MRYALFVCNHNAHQLRLARLLSAPA